MLRYTHGNLFDSKAQALVNAVNCAGVMGKGIAYAFKKKYPSMYKDYRLRCEQGLVQPGVLTLYTTTRPWIINFPTKRHWRDRTSLDDVEDGLKEFVRRYKEWGLLSVAIPALGCGLGGLNWSDVRPLIERYLGNLEIDIEVYEPGSEIDTPGDKPISQNDSLSSQVDLFGYTVSSFRIKSKRRHKKECK